MFERLENLFLKEGLEKLNKAHILLVGVGGVGSYAFETLVRSGVGKITIIDFDEYEESNLNRQLHSNQKNIGKKKVEVLKKEALLINPKIEINTLDVFLDENINLDFKNFAYIIDAIDNIKGKMLLIEKALLNNVKIICSMGMGKRLKVEDVMVTTLDKTSYDPIAKILRQNLKKKGITTNIKVVFSKEKPLKLPNLASYMGVCAHAGLLLADTVIKDIINE